MAGVVIGCRAGNALRGWQDRAALYVEEAVESVGLIVDLVFRSQFVLSIVYRGATSR